MTVYDIYGIIELTKGGTLLMTDNKRINIDLPETLWQQISIQAATENTTKRELVIKALENYLKK